MLTRLVEVIAPDADPINLDGSWRPKDVHDIDLFVEIFIEYSDEYSGVDMFSLRVCTPTAISRRVQSGPFWGQYSLIIREWDFNVVDNFIHETFDNVEFNSYEEALHTFRKITRWEDEDYVDDNLESDQFDEVADEDLPVPPKDMEAFLKEHSYRPKPTTE